MNIEHFRNAEQLKKVYFSEEARGHDTSAIGLVLKLDSEWRQANHTVQMRKQEINQLQREISRLKRDKKSAIKEIKHLTAVKNDIELLDRKVAELKRDLDTAMNNIGNIVHDSVPISKDEEDNVTVKEWGSPATELPLHHSEVMTQLNAYNMQAGSVVAGHRGYFLKNIGVFLNQALIQYGISFLSSKNYDVLSTPYFMTADMMAKTAQLSEYDELLYGLGDNKYLIATSEQPISCYHYDQWLQKKEVPLRYCGFSSCFRKEAGSAGKDLRGVFRVHQFEKIEQFCIVSPENSWEEHEKMLQISEEFLQSLGIPYRVVNIVSGALNDAAAKKYDIEGWFPNTQEYRELVSCSNCTDYQSRKLKIRYGTKEKGKKATYVHMLNSTLCATERLMCCLMETYQTDTGIVLPEVLGPYLPGGKLEWDFSN